MAKLKTTEIENRYECPKTLWKKMSEKKQIIYNNVRSHKASFIMLKETERKLTGKEVETISHNYAYLAACENA